MSDSGDVNIIKANKSLQTKVGTGKIDESTIQKCEMVIKNNDVDFAPLAMEYLDKLEAAIAGAKTGNLSRDQAVKAMTAPVMQLKANAATFNYDLIGSLANIMLGFLEGVDSMDKTVLEIVGAHHQTLKAIVLKKMTGDGGAYGMQLQDELKGACKRYFQKKRQSG